MPESPEEPESDLLQAIRAGDEAAFTRLVERYHPQMVRFARMWIRDPLQAEEVAQEAWLGALRGLDRFEGRSSLRTWLFGIVHNLARTAAQKEARHRAFVDAASREAAAPDPAVPPARFQEAGEPYPRHWRTPPRPWDRAAEQEVLDEEIRRLVEGVVQDLPEAQRTVITMRDLDGWSSQEVCNALGISQTNQRVLLHRARSKVRRALAIHYGEPS